MDTDIVDRVTHTRGHRLIIEGVTYCPEAKGHCHRLIVEGVRSNN